MIYIGAHINKEGGSLIKTIKKIKQNNGNALQLFLSNPRSTHLPNVLNYYGISEEIKEYCDTHDIKLVAHASYTINLASPPLNGKKICELQDCYWIALLIHQLISANLIGCMGIVVHVGRNTNKEEGILNQYNAIKYILNEIRDLELNTKLLLETPAGVGNELITNVGEFIDFYDKFDDIDKEYLKICIDTAHIWSAGYDINNYYDIISKNHAKDILLIHLNNSKKNKGSFVDRHEIITDGLIPINDIKIFLKKLKHNPMIILEKPSDNFQNDIKFVQDSL